MLCQIVYLRLLIRSIEKKARAIYKKYCISLLGILKSVNIKLRLQIIKLQSTLALVNLLTETFI